VASQEKSLGDTQKNDEIITMVMMVVVISNGFISGN